MTGGRYEGTYPVRLESFLSPKHWGKLTHKQKELWSLLEQLLEEDTYRGATERLVACYLAVANREALAAAGKERQRWTGEIAKGKGGPGFGTRAPTADHPYKLVDEDGEVTLQSEPYRLDTAALRELVKLADFGWNIEISGYQPLHFPGRTIIVRYRRPAKKED